MRLHSFGDLFSKPVKQWTPEDHINLENKMSAMSGKDPDPVGTFYDYALSRIESASPKIKNAFEYTRKISQQFKDFLDINGIPSLTRLGVADPAFEHGSAFLSAPRITDDLIAKVMGREDYQDWRKKSLLTGLLVKDRILAGHEYNLKLRNDAVMESEKLSGQIQTAEEDLMWYQSQLENVPLTPEREAYLQKLTENRNTLTRQKVDADTKARDQDFIIKGIEAAHNVKQYDWDVQNALRRNYIEWKDKGKIVARLDNLKDRVDAWNEHVTPELDRLWKEAKDIDPQTELENTGTYGKYTGARLSLVHKDAPSMSGASGRILKAETDAPSLESQLESKRGTANVARDPKDRRAFFTGSYTLSMEKNLNNTIRPRLEISTKENLYKALEDKGIVEFRVTPIGDLPPGVEWMKWKEPVKRPSTSYDESYRNSKN